MSQEPTEEEHQKRKYMIGNEIAYCLQALSTVTNKFDEVDLVERLCINFKTLGRMEYNYLSAKVLKENEEAKKATVDNPGAVPP